MRRGCRPALRLPRSRGGDRRERWRRQPPAAGTGPCPVRGAGARPPLSDLNCRRRPASSNGILGALSKRRVDSWQGSSPRTGKRQSCGSRLRICRPACRNTSNLGVTPCPVGQPTLSCGGLSPHSADNVHVQYVAVRRRAPVGQPPTDPRPRQAEVSPWSGDAQR